MVTAIFQRFVTDQVAFVIHAYLLGFAVFSTFVVAFGIIWESAGPLSVHAVARKLIIGGVAFEALFTIALFVFDEGISNVQRSEIKSLTEENVILRVEASPRVLDVVQIPRSAFEGKKTSES